MIDAGQFQVVGELIVHLDFQQILQLQEAEVFVPKPDLLAAMHIDVGPLTEKTLERQGGDGFLDWLADIVAGRVKDRQGAVKVGPRISQHAAGAGQRPPSATTINTTTPHQVPPRPSGSRQPEGHSFFAYRHTSSSLLFSSACDSRPNPETGAQKVLSVDFVGNLAGRLRPLRGGGNEFR